MNDRFTMAFIFLFAFVFWFLVVFPLISFFLRWCSQRRIQRARPSVMSNLGIITWNDPQQPVKDEFVPWVKSVDGKMACPDCGGVSFHDGPEGGMCINTQCAECGQKWNYTDMRLIGGALMIQRI